MNLKMLKKSLASGRDVAIELHAIEQIMYIPFIRNGDELRPLVDDRGESIRYPSRHRALVELAELGLTSLDFVHRSSYGEMVGAGEGPQTTELRETLDLRRYQE
jgi:hypothetical protein